jgi:hypothetical protein
VNVMVMDFGFEDLDYGFLILFREALRHLSSFYRALQGRYAGITSLALSSGCCSRRGRSGQLRAEMSSPQSCFWRMNGEVALGCPKRSGCTGCTKVHSPERV